jgi:hypothetical protein
LLEEEHSTMDEVILRAVERLLAVIIGGLSVYQGYRLFLCIPEQKEEAEHREVTIRREEIKLLLMEKAWGQDWGSFEAFRLWVESVAQDPVPTTVTATA